MQEMDLVQRSQIQALIDAELAEISDERVALHVRAHLVQPALIMRDWSWGNEGEAYPSWTVLEHQRTKSGIAFSECCFGPRTPWGLVNLSGSGDMSMGMDCDWFETFLQAFFDSAAATDLPIWRVFIQIGDQYPGVAITTESDWTATWDEVKRLRVADPSARYHCEQSIYNWRPED